MTGPLGSIGLLKNLSVKAQESGYISDEGNKLGEVGGTFDSQCSAFNPIISLPEYNPTSIGFL